MASRDVNPADDTEGEKAAVSFALSVIAADRLTDLLPVVQTLPRCYFHNESVDQSSWFFDPFYEVERRCR